MPLALLLSFMFILMNLDDNTLYVTDEHNEKYMFFKGFFFFGKVIQVAIQVKFLFISLL